MAMSEFKAASAACVHRDFAHDPAAKTNEIKPRKHKQLVMPARRAVRRLNRDAT
jgi:hypothetical protein